VTSPDSSARPARPAGSRIAAAKKRSEQAKTAILAVAVIAFFGAMTVERGAAHKSTGTQPSASSSQLDGGSDFFDNGSIAPAQGAPSTSTGTS
jgi:hypothetical protein